MLNGTATRIRATTPGRASESRFGAWAGNTLRVLRFLFVEGRIARDPVVLLALAASLGRAGMIFGINETARAEGQPIWQLTLLFGSAILFLAAAYFARLRAYMIIVELGRRLRLRLSELLLRARPDFLQQKDRGEIYSGMTWAVDEAASAAVNVIESIQAVLLILICVPYLFWISWAAGLATFAAISIGVLGFVVFEAPARGHVMRANRARAVLCDRVDDMLSGWKEIRLRERRRADLREDYVGTLDELSASRVQSEKLFAASGIAAQAAVIILLLTVVVPIPFMQSENGTALFQILTVILLTYGPIEMVFAALPKLSRAEAAHARLMRVEDELRQAQSPEPLPGTLPARPRFSAIELRGVTAHLLDQAQNPTDERGFFLGPVDLTLRPGETVFISGANGSGKTTLLDIITGLRRPDGGRLVWDGEEVGEDRLPAYRELFSAVFSRFHLFEKPYGLDAGEQAVLLAALSELGLAHRIGIAGDRFTSLALSSGQRRRLALAIAVAESRPVIVFDEFAADQDPDYRAFFYDVLLPRLAAKKHLIIAITHDDSQFAKCDRLLKLEAGRIVAERSPALQ